MTSDSLPTVYQTYQHRSKYSRWRDDLGGRREFWPETVDRYIDFWDERFESACWTPDECAVLRSALGRLDAVPSMRCLMTAGPALAKDEAAGYNCTYEVVNRVEAFDEAMYLLMCGVGVGYSVERKYVEQLPVVPSELVQVTRAIVVGDSKEGWAKAFRELLKGLYAGEVRPWDMSGVRPSGALLKTFGGRASGPLPLVALFRLTVETFQGARGRKLTEKECHSLMCKVGDIVVVGGVRRSAMIALFSEFDADMRNAKMGDYPVHFAMANNSAVFQTKPSAEHFFSGFKTLIKSRAGEPGYFNREAAQYQASRWGKRSATEEYGCNPCGEILLRDQQMCNLSEVIARPGDTKAQLLEKIRVATVFGTLQSTLTNFRYLNARWKKNCEEERLLGVSIAGLPDHPLLNGSRGQARLEDFLDEGRELTVDTNAMWADRLGVPHSTALTCLKPSGNTSQLVGAASPLKPHHAKRYVRRTRGSKNDPVTQLLVDSGVPHEDEAWHPDTTVVFNWAMEAPTGAKTRHDWTALQQLDLWQTYHDHWCDHKPSATINVREHEWPDVAAWVWNKWDKMSGLAFLPDDDHAYVQAPYEEVSDEEWEKLRDEHPTSIDWGALALYEGEDHTVSAQELACSAGACEI